MAVVRKNAPPLYLYQDLSFGTITAEEQANFTVRKGLTMGSREFDVNSHFVPKCSYSSYIVYTIYNESRGKKNRLILFFFLNVLK
jgi:hypothetical protein